MKNSGVEWIGEIPYEWEVRKFKYFFDIYGGSGFKEEYQGQENGDFPFCKASDINGTEKNLISAKNYVNQDLVDKESYIIIPKNSILVSKIGEALKKNHRKVNLVNCIVDNNCEGFVLNSKNDINYLYYVLKCIDMSWFDNGGTIPSINNFKLKNFLLPNCLYEIQQRIATYLDKKCSKIEETIQKQQQVIEKLKAYKQSLITEAVTGKVKIVNGKACGEYESYKDSGVEWIGKIPSEWDTIRIKWLLNERKERSEEGKEEPLSMSQKYGLIPTKEMETIPNMASTFVGAKLTYKDDIVFNKLKAHLGVFSVSKYDGLVSPDYAVYTSTGKADLKYLEYLFKTPQCISEFKKRSTGVGEGLTRLYTGELFSIYIPFPEKKTQKNIANFLVSISTAIDTAIEQKQKLIEKLTEYKKSLIYECVTGKKEI